MPRSIEKLVAGHVVISNHFPRVKPIDDIDRLLTDRTDFVEKFGFFGVDTPNMTQYYPDLTAEDLQPKDEDYIYPVVRAFSEVVINRYGPLDFTKKNVLKSTAYKLEGQSLYLNHEMVVGNEVGAIESIAYQNSYTVKLKDGKELRVPAGINARLKIDGKSNPKLARNIMSDPPIVHSLSVTVEFEWAKSHAKMSDDEFFSKLGAFDENGEMIRRIVTGIVSYHELSFVPHGQDPFAQLVGEDGKIINPDYAHSRLGRAVFSEESYQKLAHVVDYANMAQFSYQENPSNNRVTILSFNLNDQGLSKSPEITETQNKEVMNKKLLEILRANHGLAADATEEQAIALAEQVFGQAAEVATLKQEISDKDTKITSLEAELATTKATTEKFKDVDVEKAQFHQAIATSAISQLREQTEKNYRLIAGDKVDDSIVGLIKEANYESLKGLNKQYATQLDEKHPLACAKCGSKEVSRASASEETEEGGEPFSIRDTADVANEITRIKLQKKASFIHGSDE